FFFQAEDGIRDPLVTGVQTCALPILVNRCRHFIYTTALPPQVGAWWLDALSLVHGDDAARQALGDRFELFRADLASNGIKTGGTDRKSTRLNCSHEWISYAVFCLKKK